ncbi:uncharacterized protein METZ01_LOCUS467922, partial [marine metagenome]|jgi:putative phosphoesterase
VRIGLISDTHIPGGAAEIPEAVSRVFSGVDLILHSGNIYKPAILDQLETIAPVKAAGSVDRDHQCRDDPRVEEKQILNIEGHSIGVVHDLILPGWGGDVYPGSIETYLSDISIPTVMEEIFGTAVDIVIFGHSCRVTIEEHDEVLLINPGSPTLRNQLRMIGHVAILDLKPGERHVQSIDLSG